MIKNLFVFDFDDTLAKTVAHIGIARLMPDGKDDALFPMWLENHDLYPEFSKKSGDVTFYYLPSENFATYQKLAAGADIGEAKDEFDFEETAGVDIETTEGHRKIINILKRAQGQPDSKVIIVTARGSDELQGPFGNMEMTNREDIAAFLVSMGANIDGSAIFPVGSSDPQHKANVVQRYIEHLNPEHVYFYDDNELNLNAIHELCAEYYPATEIHVIKVTDGHQESPKNCD